MGFSLQPHRVSDSAWPQHLRWPLQHQLPSVPLRVLELRVRLTLRLFSLQMWASDCQEAPFSELKASDSSGR